MQGTGTRTGRVQVVTRPELELHNKRKCPLCGVTSTPKGIVDVRITNFGGHCTACGYTYNNRGSAIPASYVEGGPTVTPPVVPPVDPPVGTVTSPLLLPFTFADFASGHMDVAKAVPAGKTISKTTISVTAEFNAGTKVTVGTALEPAKFMADNGSDMTYVADYFADPALLCASATTVQVTFVGTPTAGTAVLTVDFV